MIKKNVNGEEVEVEATETETETQEDTVDQEAVDTTVAEHVEQSAETVADAIVQKFVTKMQNAPKASGTKTNVARGVETRKFFTALADRDTTYLKGMRNSVDEDGGYLVPTELSTEILRVSEGEYGVARSEFRYLPFGGAGIKRIIPKLTSSVAVYWLEEGAKKPGTKATFGVVTQVMKKLAAIVPLTEEIVEDTDIDIVRLIAELFVEAVAKEEDLQYFDGDGTVWDGILRRTTAAPNKPTVPSLVSASNTFDGISADELLDLQFKVASGARAGAKYYMNPSVLAVLRKKKDANEQYIFQSPAGSAFATIWNKPVVEVDVFPGTDLSAANQKNRGVVLFGNLKLGAIYGDKKGMRVKVLTEATITDSDGSTAINLAEQDMLALRIHKRTGYVIANEKAMAVLKTANTA